MTPFGTWLHDHGISYANAARELGITRAYVHQLAKGTATPRLDTLGVEVAAWTAELDPDAPVNVESWLPWCKAFRRFKNLKQFG